MYKTLQDIPKEQPANTRLTYDSAVGCRAIEAIRALETDDRILMISALMVESELVYNGLIVGVRAGYIMQSRIDEVLQVPERYARNNNLDEKEKQQARITARGAMAVLAAMSEEPYINNFDSQIDILGVFSAVTQDEPAAVVEVDYANA